MGETQMSVEEMKRDVTSLSNTVDNLRSEVTGNINCLSNRLDNLEARLSDLNDSVKRALQILPKVESLLENHGCNVSSNTSVADRPASNAQSPLTLLQAAEDGDDEAILSLLKEGVDISQRNRDGDSALHVAARAGHELVVIVLLRHCPVDLPGHRGRTPLHYASGKGHVSIVQRLLLAGADVDAKDRRGNFALLLAAKAGHLNVVELLANNGVPLDEADMYSNTSLVAAAKAGKWDVVKFLLERGASAEIHNWRRSNTPLCLVMEDKQFSLIPLMLKQMQQKEREMKYALICSDDDGIVPFIFEGVVLGFSKSKEARDVMANLAFEGKVNMMSAMLDIGADVNGLDSNGLSYLGYAAWNGKVETLKLLLRRGASLNLVNGLYGNAALHCAAVQGHMECVHALLHAGAAVDIRNKQYKTPMDLAKTDEIRQILTSHLSQS